MLRCFPAGIDSDKKKTASPDIDMVKEEEGTLGKLTAFTLDIWFTAVKT